MIDSLVLVGGDWSSEIRDCTYFCNNFNDQKLFFICTCWWLYLRLVCEFRHWSLGTLLDWQVPFNVVTYSRSQSVSDTYILYPHRSMRTTATHGYCFDSSRFRLGQVLAPKRADAGCLVRTLCRFVNAQEPIKTSAVEPIKMSRQNRTIHSSFTTTLQSLFYLQTRHFSGGEGRKEREAGKDMEGRKELVLEMNCNNRYNSSSNITLIT